MNWCKILQVKSTADGSSVKKQFRELAILLNPDKNKLAGAEEAFILVIKAYRTLSDTEKRDRYDVNVNENIKATPQGEQSQQVGETALISEVKRGQNSAKLLNSNDRQKIMSSLVLGPNESDNIDSEDLAMKVDDTPTKTFVPKFMEITSTRLNKKISCDGVGSGDGYSITKVFAPTSTPQRSTRLRKNVSSSEFGSQYGNNVFVNPPCTKKRRIDSSQHNKELYHVLANGEDVGGIMTDVSNKPNKHSQLQKRLQRQNELMEGCERWTEMEEETTGKTIQCSSHNLDEANAFYYPNSEFYDFDKPRSASCFQAGQIWAIYDDKDGMPRFYALIKQVHAPEFSVHFTWLEHIPGNVSDAELPIACGNYSLEASDISKNLRMFSHLVTWQKGKKRNSYVIYPRAGQVWALFKDWSIEWSSDSDNYQNFNYEVVEVISKFSVNNGTKIIPLIKIEGFVSLFVRAEGKKGVPVVIPASEILRFSHRVPAYRLSGTERKGIPANSMELDCASLPVNIMKAVPSASLGCRTGNVDPTCTKKRKIDSSQHNKELSRVIANREEVGGIRTDVSNKPHKHSQLQKRLQHQNELMEGCERWTEMEEESSEKTIQYSLYNLDEAHVVRFPDPEFCDFDKLRSAICFQAGQIWAIYDDKDGMPRFYARIKQVHAPEFGVHFTWLEHIPGNVSDAELPIACGNYSLEASDISKNLRMFSHLVTWQKGKKRNSYDIYPRAGQVWALFKDWSIEWSSDSNIYQNCDYEVVEVISEFSANNGTKIIPLVKIEGSVSLFVHAEGKKGVPVMIPASEILRFSHRVPAYRLSGTERKGIPANSMELDCASLPVNIMKAVPSASLGCRTGNVDPPCTKKRRIDSSQHNKELSHVIANGEEVGGIRTDVSNRPHKHSQLQKRLQHQNELMEGCERWTEMEEESSEKTIQYSSYNLDEARVVRFPDPEFCDFDKLRSASCFQAGQIWAIYDDKDGMPRFYARIKQVHAPEFSVHFTWLEHIPGNVSDAELPIACGNYSLEASDISKDLWMFSHLVTWQKGKKRNSYDIYPRAGQVWALFKDWSIEWSFDSNNYQNCNYEVVEVISEFSVNNGTKIIPLVKIEGSVSLFVHAEGKKGVPVMIPASEILRFSHRVPAYRLSGTERKGIPANSMELDCASLPVNIMKVVPSASLGCRTGNVDKIDRHSSSHFKATMGSDDGIRIQHKKHKGKNADLSVVMSNENTSPLSPTMFEYPDPEFHNFDKLRSIEHFQRGQVWALYSDIDKYPKYYGWIRKVELENRRLHVAWLESCPLGEEEIRWISEEMPVGCGTFKFTQKIMVFGRSEFFSHPVHTKHTAKKGQFAILPNFSEVWAIYKNWKVGWRSSDLVNCEYDVVEICEATDASIKVLLLTRVSGYKTVFKSERTGNSLAIIEIPADEYIRFSHQIPAHRLTDESGGKLHGYWELDAAAVPDHLLC